MAAGGDVYQWVSQFVGARPSFAVSLLADPEPVPADAGPSALLVARREVVPFTGRAVERDDLAAWLDGAAPSAARLVTGPGGAGKTRLALQVARDAQDRGWFALTARHRLDGGTLIQAARGGSSGGESVTLDRCAGVLLLVDYADRWPLSDLLELLEDPRLHSLRGRVRVLLLARSGRFWTSMVADLLRQVGTQISQASLKPLTPGVSERETVFDAAVAAFTAKGLIAADGVDARAVRRPASLAGEAFGLMLSVQMAALVAVLTAADDLSGDRVRRLVDDPAAASRHLIRREVRHWARRRSPDVPDPVTCSTAVMARAVFVATLTRGMADQDAAALLDRLQDGRRGELGAATRTLLDDHRRCYPPADPARSLEPLLPDRLGEDFVAALLPGAPDDRQDPDSLAELADPVTTELLSRLLRDTTPGGASTSGDGGAANGAATAPTRHPLTRPVLTTLVETARRRDHVATGHLIPALAEDPQLALAAGGTPLAQLCDIAGIDTVLARIGDAVDDVIGAGIHLDLDPGAAVVAERLVDAARAAKDLALLAARLNTFSIRLGSLGRWDAALAASEEAVTIHRQLASADPNAFADGLAASLSTLSVQLGGLGRSKDALAASEEAVTTFRQLAAAHPDAFGPALARSLHNLSAGLTDLGRSKDALAASEEAVTLHRQLAATNPDAFGPDLARSLHNLSTALADLERPKDALAASEEAVTIHRQLAATDSDAFLPDLATSLYNLSNRLEHLGRPKAALAASAEAVTLHRQLTAIRPDAFLPDLAMSLNNLSGRLAGLGLPEDALAASEEAVTIRRRLAATHPDAFGPDLARSLYNLSADLAGLGRLEDSLVASEEAVTTFRQLAAARPDAFLPDLAMSLHNLSARLGGLGRRENALAASEEAVTTYRQLAAAHPKVFGAAVQRALRLRAWLLSLEPAPDKAEDR